MKSGFVGGTASFKSALGGAGCGGFFIYFLCLRGGSKRIALSSRPAWATQKDCKKEKCGGENMYGVFKIGEGS